MQLIEKYFPELSNEQLLLYKAFCDIFVEWNRSINLISRNDIINIQERHLLHSLSIAKIIKFADNTNIMDAGTGGGFPGIPLAIMFPNVNFHLVDSIQKKIKVVNDIVDQLDLKNVTTSVERFENLNTKHHFILSRAVMQLPEFYKFTSRLIDKNNFNTLNNGILYLKGGDIEAETLLLKSKCNIKEYNISDYFNEEFFFTKKIIHIVSVKG